MLRHPGAERSEGTRDPSTGAVNDLTVSVHGFRVRAFGAPERRGIVNSYPYPVLRPCSTRSRNFFTLASPA